MSLASIQTPDSVDVEFRGGSTHTVERALAIVREHLEMDVAYVAEFTGGSRNSSPIVEVSSTRRWPRL